MEAISSTKTGARTVVVHFGEPKRFVIGVQSADCLSFHQFPNKQKSARNRVAFAFQVEELVPVDGDDLVLDWVRSPEGSLVVAIECNGIIDHVDAIELEGGEIVAIVPIAFLMLSKIVEVANASPNCVVAICTEHGMDQIEVTDAKPSRWLWQEGDFRGCLTRDLHEMDADSREKIIVFENESDSSPSEVLPENAKLVYLNSEEVMQSVATQIIQGRKEPLINLARPPIVAPVPFSNLRQALFVMFACILMSELILLSKATFDTSQLGALSQDQLVRMEEDFRAINPSGPIPVGVVRRMESEFRELNATRGVEAPKVESSIPVLLKLLEAMPDSKDNRYNLKVLSVSGPRELTLKGAARDIKALETIAAGLRQSGFDVPPTSVSQVRDGVAIDLPNLRWKGSADLQTGVDASTNGQGGVR